MNWLRVDVLRAKLGIFGVGLATLAVGAGNAHAQDLTETKPKPPPAQQVAPKPHPAPTQPAQAKPAPAIASPQQICESSGGKWTGGTCDFSALAANAQRDSCSKVAGVWNDANKDCECPPGKAWRVLRGNSMCIKECSPDQDFDSNRGCVSRTLKASDCEKDTVWDGTQCRANCSAGKHFESGNGCVVDQPALAALMPSEPFPYQFDPGQLQQLRAAGFQGSLDDMPAAQRMKARQFSSADYVRAYSELSQRGVNNKAGVESIAASALLGLPDDEHPRVLEQTGQTPVTDYYNNRIGGRGMVIFGWILVPGGITSAIISGTMLAMAQGSYCSSALQSSGFASANDCKVAFDVSAGTFGVIAVAALAAGIPLLVIGHSHLNRWAPGGLLDTGTVKQLEPYRLGTEKRPENSSGFRSQVTEAQAGELTLQLVPFGTKESSGMALRMTF